MPQDQRPTRPPSRAREPRQHAIHYGFAVASVAAATVVRFPFEPFLHRQAPFALYYLPILLIAWYCGVGPTLFATALSVASAWMFFLTYTEPGSAAALFLFLLVSGAMVLLARAARRIRDEREVALATARDYEHAADFAAWEWEVGDPVVRSQGLPALLGLDLASGVAPTRQQLRALIHPDDLPEAERQLREALETGGQFRLEFRIRSPLRGERWLASVGEVRRGPAGPLARVAGLSLDVTERKRSEETRAHLAAIVESSDDAIITKDLEGKIQSFNTAAERLFGYPASDIVGKPVTVLIPTDRQAEEMEILGQLRRGERVDHYETVRLAKDGRAVDVSLTISPIRGPSGAIVGASKIARDITDRKLAAEALAAQREWFRVTLGSIGDAVIAADVDGRVTFMNPLAEALTGWPAAEATQRPLAEVFHIIGEKTRQRVENPAEKVIRSGLVLGLANHTALISRDGTEHPIADSAAPILDDRGRILGVVMVFRDVTERRRAEEALAEQREWLETTLESIGDAVIATDIRGDVVFMNRVAETLTGWGAAKARGQSCDRVFHIVNEATRQPAANPIRRAIQEGVVVGLANHTVLIAADGTERPIDDSGAPIRSRDGRIVGVVLVFRDVSERRRVETERQAAARDRERLLESERVARAEAERANRIKDDFVAMVSHELRTPLTAILGWTVLLAEDSSDPQRLRHGLEVVERNTRMQAQLISDLLDISRIVSGKLRLEVQNVDLGAVITDAIQTVQPAAEAKGIELRREIDQALGSTVGDPGRLQQAVWNLLSNAIKFSPRGGAVTVRLQRVDSDAEITVADNGTGIRPDALPFVFERFRQGEAPTTRRFGGLGLGLAIVKQLIELHGGSVSADSGGEGKGATFTLRLPIVARRAADHAATSGAARMDVPADHAPLDNIRVLVVEDEPDTRDLVERLLREHRAEVVVAASAREALVALAEKQPDILVSDIGLADMDGYELIQTIRLLDADAGGRIPAVALTALARSEDRTRALRAGYQAHIAKPVEPAELVAAVASFVGLIAARRKTESSGTPSAEEPGGPREGG